MELFKGNLVRDTASGLVGVVADRAPHAGECLVRFDRGTDRSGLDATHGRWMPVESLVKIGHDPEALVWRLTRLAPAGPDEGEAVSQRVTTHTVVSATYPNRGTWAVSSKVTETLAGALSHVSALFEDDPTTVVGGTRDGRVIRYARAYMTETGSTAHDMVIIVRH